MVCWSGYPCSISVEWQFTICCSDWYSVWRTYVVKQQSFRMMLSCKYVLVHKLDIAGFSEYMLWLLGITFSFTLAAPHIKLYVCLLWIKWIKFCFTLWRKQLQKHTECMKLLMVTRVYLVHMSSSGLEIQWNMWVLRRWSKKWTLVSCLKAGNSCNTSKTGGQRPSNDPKIDGGSAAHSLKMFSWILLKDLGKRELCTKLVAHSRWMTTSCHDIEMLPGSATHLIHLIL